MFAQNTSLVVDNQNPGWLSSKIPFKNQESVKNLTVTGYINGTDIKFIRELINNRALTHLDLTNTNIIIPTKWKKIILCIMRCFLGKQME